MKNFVTDSCGQFDQGDRNKQNKLHIENTEDAQASLAEDQMLSVKELAQKVRECELQNQQLLLQLDALRTERNTLTKAHWELLQKYTRIANSNSWKITKPLRTCVRKLKKALKNSRAARLVWKGVKHWLQNGFVSTCKQVVHAIRWRLCTPAKQPEEIPMVQTPIAPERLFSAKDQLLSLDAKIAVHVHLYYVDLLEEFFTYVDRIPFSFDIFVSTKQGADLHQIENRLRELKHVGKVTVKETINRGRDIAPLYVQFGEEIASYDYFLHVHSKKSLFTGTEQYGWRRYSLDCLLGSEELIRRIFYQFEHNNIGLFFPEIFSKMHLIANSWLANSDLAKQLLGSMGIEFDNGLFNYPVGSFFWAKTDALRALFDRKLKYEDFPEEAGQLDGTLAHALERVIAPITKAAGYELAIYDTTTDILNIGSSLHIYQEYFSLDANMLQLHLSQFELVSFSIFDTLLTRKVLLPDGVFLLMEKKIREEFGLDLDFVRLRKAAESRAWNKKKDLCSIHDIYYEFSSIAGISMDICARIKQLEINTELDLCLPRRDMRKIFDHLKACGKKIVLVSDTYLTSDILAAMLNKCGYSGWEEIWSSCEKGARKDNNTIWDAFNIKYGSLNSIHVGDDPYSDTQVLADRKMQFFFIMNPATQMKLSKLYPVLKPYMNTTAENSLLLGTLINGQLFNSPFSQDRDANPHIHDMEDFGYCTFGPLLASFILWMDEKTQDKEKLLFLSREGYLLKQIYDIYCDVFEEDKSRAMYFLTSRRAASVAALKTKDDLRDIVGQFYRGTFSNLLKARLGIDLHKDQEDINVEIPEQLDTVMEMLVPYEEEIFQNAAAERDSYLSYIKNEGILQKETAVIDVGYSGTIQYFLTKLMDCKLSGYYLATSNNKKPEKLGCVCEAVYPFKTEDPPAVFRHQLFLEAIMKAPFGQLLFFDGKTNEAVYAGDAVMNSAERKAQAGILSFAQEYFKTLKNYTSAPDMDKQLVQSIFDATLSMGIISDAEDSHFCVQDDYCSNGKQYFDTAENRWKVQ